jgi:hypothetical protein
MIREQIVAGLRAELATIHIHSPECSGRREVCRERHTHALDCGLIRCGNAQPYRAQERVACLRAAIEMLEADRTGEALSHEWEDGYGGTLVLKGNDGSTQPICIRGGPHGAAATLRATAAQVERET